MGGIPDGEEPAWGQWIPDHGKFNVLATDTLVHHYSFFVQQGWLDRTSLLEDVRRTNLPDSRRLRTATDYHAPRVLRVLKQILPALKRRLAGKH